MKLEIRFFLKKSYEFLKRRLNSFQNWKKIIEFQKKKGNTLDIFLKSCLSHPSPRALLNQKWYI